MGEGLGVGVTPSPLMGEGLGVGVKYLRELQRPVEKPVLDGEGFGERQGLGE